MWHLRTSRFIFPILIFVFMLSSCEKGEIVSAVDPLVELHAVYVDSRPEVDGYDNDSVWENAQPYVIHVYKTSEDGNTIDYNSGFNVTLKAIWWKSWMLSGDNWVERPFLSIYITWSDDNKNIEKNAWYYNPTDTTWRRSQNGSDWLLFTWYNSNYVDLWYWDAALTNPSGYAEDQYIELIEIDTITTVTIFNTDGANYNNDFGDFRNAWDMNYDDNLTPRDSTDDRPKMAWKYPVDSTEAFPSLPRIYSDVDERKKFLFSSDADLLSNTPYLDINAEVMIPGYVLNDPIGPSTDIFAAGIYRDGYWTVEIVRPAATDDEDANDIGFIPSSRYSVYYFNIIIGNNSKSPFESGSKMFTGSGETSFTFEFVL